jgi:hypothetical protein
VLDRSIRLLAGRYGAICPRRSDMFRTSISVTEEVAMMEREEFV